MFYGAAEILLLGEAARHGIGPVGKGILTVFCASVLIGTVITGARYTFNFIKKLREEKNT